MKSDRLHRILKPRKPKKPLENTITKRILKEIGSNLSGKKYFPTDLTPLLFRWIEIQLKHGLTVEDVAGELNNLKIPTLSGIGSWRSDTIEYLTGYLK
jgi:hypothetical protein